MPGRSSSTHPTRQEPDVTEVAAALRVSIGLLLRRLRQVRPRGELSPPETSAPATLAALETRGLVARHPDPEDGRRAVLSLTEAGQQLLRDKRSARVAQLAQSLTAAFTAAEISQLKAAAPLLERLAQNI